MADKLSVKERSAQMAKVKSSGNRSTEFRVEQALKLNRIHGWIKHPINIKGKPDFLFPVEKLLIFVDGCFWHACPKCGRLPSSRQEYWVPKIDSNRRRDNRIRRLLRKEGYSVIRVWEHELKQDLWIKRIRRALISDG